MWDARIAEVAGRQFNRISRGQLMEVGLDDEAIYRRARSGRLVPAGRGVYAVAPLLEHDDWGKWMGATLTAPGSVLSHGWAAYAWKCWYRPEEPITVTRPGSGGPRHLSGTMAYRSSTVAAESTALNRVPITTIERTLLDQARYASDAALARGVREGIRKWTSFEALAAFVIERSNRRGAGRMLKVLRGYSGLPIERARSGAEVKALMLLRDAERPMPRLNVRIAGEEADLSWPEFKLIVEIDGGPYHQDVGEDARKEAAWRSAGWKVRRVPADDVYKRPHHLLDATPTNVP